MRNKKLFLTILVGVMISCHQANAQQKYSYTKWHVDSIGTKIGQSEFKSFDNQNNLIKWIQYLDNGKFQIDSFAYEFEGKNKVQEFRYTNGKLWGRTVFIYGKDKKLSETRRFDSNNKYENATKHNYSDKLEVVEHIADCKVYSIDTLIYNRKNRKISETQYLSNGTWFQKHKYEYDVKGNLVFKQSEANSEFDGIGLIEYRYVVGKNNKTQSETVLFPDKSKKYYIYEY